MMHPSIYRLCLEEDLADQLPTYSISWPTTSSHASLARDSHSIYHHHPITVLYSPIGVTVRPGKNLTILGKVEPFPISHWIY